MLLRQCIHKRSKKPGALHLHAPAKHVNGFAGLHARGRHASSAAAPQLQPEVGKECDKEFKMPAADKHHGSRQILHNEMGKLYLYPA